MEFVQYITEKIYVKAFFSLENLGHWHMCVYILFLFYIVSAFLCEINVIIIIIIIMMMNAE